MFRSLTHSDWSIKRTPVGVMESVERVVASALCRRDVGNHDRLTVADE